MPILVHSSVTDTCCTTHVLCIIYPLDARMQCSPAIARSTSKTRTGRISDNGITSQTTRKPRPETLPGQKSRGPRNGIIFSPLLVVVACSADGGGDSGGRDGGDEGGEVVLLSGGTHQNKICSVTRHLPLGDLGQRLCAFCCGGRRTPFFGISPRYTVTLLKSIVVRARE